MVRGVRSTVARDPRGSYARFLQLAAPLLLRGVGPSDVLWQDTVTDGASLFIGDGPDESPPAAAAAMLQRIKRTLGSAGDLASCHRDPGRWGLLYSLAHQAIIRRRPVLAALDPDARAMELLAKDVRRDVHKMKAFVRFRRVEDGGPERFVAWHRPDHRIMRLAAPFFARRFGVLRWTIFTPAESADWDGERLSFGGGVPASDVRDQDALERLWRTYYSSIFNPARIKLDAMVKEMPARHWATLPETRIINDLLKTAPDRVRRMIAMTVRDTGAADFIPKENVPLPVLNAAAKGCAGCGLAELATQTVVGEGPLNARIMLVGEQPGDEEDLAGRPFVGPAGRLLDEALVRAGIDRAGAYITNSVKHFKFEQRGKRRIHKRPSVAEIRACGPWLEREIALVRPEIIILLGSTAGQALLGPGYRVHTSRGTCIDDPVRGTRLFATVHPSMILRTPEPDRGAAFEEFVSDLARARAGLAGSDAPAGDLPRAA